MKNKHITVLPNKFFFKNIILYDLTYGCGGYVNNFFLNNIIYAIDLDNKSYFLSQKIFNKNFFFFKIKIKKICFLFNIFFKKKYDVLIYDQGYNSCQIKNFFYTLNKKKYIIIKNKINKNIKTIFYKIINNSNKNSIIIITTFNIYEHFKLIFFIKKIKKFNIKIIKPNIFELSLNNSIKNSIIHIIYVKKNKK